MKSIIKYLDYIIYWSIVFIPLSIAIASAPMNVFMGFLIASFLLKKLLKKEPLFIKTAINVPLLFLFLITCLSVLNSVNLKDTFKGGILRLLQYIFIFFILTEEVKERAQIKKIIFSIAAGLFLSCADEFWQVLTGHDFIRRYAPVINIGLVRATASFKDANTLGIYLSALTPLILGLSLYYFKYKKKLAFILLSLIALLGVTLTYSRPTLLAIYVALFFLGLVRKNKVLIVCLIIFTLISPFILPKSVKEWARQVDYNPLRFMCNDDRIAIYRNSLNMIKGHPVIGVGANTYMKNYKKYKESPEYRNVITSDYLYAHNNFLHLAAEIGLVGLAIFLWLLYRLFRQCLNIYQHLDERFFKIMSLSLSACLIAFLVNGLTESSLYSSRVAMIFWYIIGLSLGLNKFTPKNILVIRNDRFGEFLLNIPAIRALKETFTNAKITIIVNPDVRELAEAIPFMDGIIEWGRTKHSLSAKLQLIKLLRRKNIALAVILNPSKEFNIITWFCGIPIRAGYDRKWGFLLTHKMEDKKYLGDKHEIEYNLELVRLVGAKTDDKTLSLIIEDDIIKNILQEFNIENCNNLVAFHPWTSDPIKQWPINNFRELAQRLIKELNIKLIIIGGRNELAESAQFFSNLSSNMINLTGKTTLKQSAALLKKCKLLISCDSGPVHLASCVGLPVIAIFRSDILAKSSVRWGPRSTRSVVIEKSNLSDIMVDEVFNKVKEVFQ